MGSPDRYFMNDRGKADHTLRCTLFAAANGDDREAALAALESLRRIYHLRLPLQEARLGMNPGLRHAGAGGSDHVGARCDVPDQEAA